MQNKTTKRRWGYFEIFLKGKGFWIKKLTFTGGSIHYQNHKERDEMWLIYIPKGVKHQIKGIGSIMEIAFGKPKEKDVKYYTKK